MLNQQEKELSAIAKYMAQGQLEKLQIALHTALDNDMSVNKAKEALVQLYAYCGFPRSLNGLGVLLNVVKNRQAQGLRIREGKSVKTLPLDDNLAVGTKTQTQLVGSEVKGELFEFAPAIDYYLKAHLFGDIFAGDLLTWREREIITIAALSVMQGLDEQLNAHKNIGKHNGLSDDEIFLIINHCDK